MDWNKCYTKNKSKWVILITQLLIMISMLTMPVASQDIEENASLVSTLADVNVNNDITKSVVLNKVISLKVENAGLITALNEIAKKVNLKVAYNESIIENLDQKKVTLDQNQITVHDALWKVLEVTDLRYAITSNRNLVLFKRFVEKPSSSPPFQEEITGQVTDAETGEIIPGVNVLVKGTNTGTSTDLDGRFELTVPSLSDTLLFSSVGYQQLEVPIAGQLELNVEMETQTILGDEMVVTAFGLEREQKSLTYSTQSVDTEQFSEARELNVINSLQGKVAGLIINTSSTGVGSASRVVLRGNRSISGSSQPLYVLDGVPIQGNPQDINPDDIVGVEILKGPNAAALYGSAAQNGAIVMTTRSARPNTVNVSLSNTFQFEDPILTIPFQNEYGQGSGGVYSPTSEYSWGPRMEGQQVDFWSPNPNHELYGQTYAFTPQPDNGSNIFRRGYNNSTNLTASVGGESTQTMFSYTLTNAQGMIPTNSMVRQNVSLRVGSQVTEKLSVDSKITFMQQTIDNQVNTGEGFENPMRNAYRLPRNIRTSHLSDFEYIDANGINRQNYFNPNSNGGNNPYWVMNRMQSENSRERVIALASLTYNFSDALSLMVRGSYDGSFNNSEEKIWVDSYVIADQGEYDVGFSRSWERNGDFLLSFDDNINEKFEYNVNFGGSIQQQRNEGLSSNTNDDVGLTVPNLFALSNTQNVLSSHNVGLPQDIQSLYAFGQLSYQNSLFLDLTGRNDWSSTLPENDQSYFYPSIGLSAVLNDLIPAFPEFFTFVKVRASWAEVGNSAPPYSLTRSATISAGGNGGFLSLSNTIPNANLRPEVTVSKELGLDVRFFEGRFGIDITAYLMNTRDQLFTVALPVGSGASQFFTNGGNVENKGLEVLLSTQPVKNANFLWDLNFNFGFNRNTVVSISEERPRVQIGSNFIRDYVIEEGEPFGNIYSRDILRDEQGRVIIDSNGLPLLSAGRTELVANYTPDWTGSILSSFSYKNFTATFLIDHRQGGSMVAQGDAIIFADGVTEQTLEGREGSLIYGDNFFAGETAIMEDGSPNTTAIDAETFWRHVGGRNAPVGGLFVDSSTNTRLREMTIGYNLPTSLLANLPVSQVRVSLVGRNLFFLYKASENNDPDILTGTGEASEGLNSFALPTPRTFGANFKIDF